MRLKDWIQTRPKVLGDQSTEEKLLEIFAMVLMTVSILGVSWLVLVTI